MKKTTEIINMTITNIYDGDVSHIIKEESGKMIAEHYKRLLGADDVRVEYGKTFVTEEK